MAFQPAGAAPSLKQTGAQRSSEVRPSFGPIKALPGHAVARGSQCLQIDSLPFKPATRACAADLVTLAFPTQEMPALFQRGGDSYG